MQPTLSAIVYATFLWWFSTGVIFYLNARSPATFRWSLLGASAIAVAALYGIWSTASGSSVSDAFIAFTGGLVLWGWHTMSYYMGVVTGPRRTACPEDSNGFQRFAYALLTSLYHELAIVATAGLLAWMTWGQANTLALWTFVLLWAMHVSAKLNVFLGVRNLNTEFIPERLTYLTTYFRQKSMNLLFPVSVTAGTILTAWLAWQAGLVHTGAMATTGYVLLATLSALAVIEHWFMVLPIPAEALWRWSLNRRRVRDASRGAASARSVGLGGTASGTAES